MDNEINQFIIYLKPHKNNKEDPYFVRKLLFFLLSLCLCFSCACNYPTPTPNKEKKQNSSSEEKRSTKMKISKQDLILKYGHLSPSEWGERVTGVKQRLHTNEKVVALTFDACGGPNGSQYDQKLIEYLIRQQIPATLFINSRWIDANRSTFLQLARQPLFEIENHGTNHQPLSVNGKSVYGMKGTQNIDEIIEEIWQNHRKITQLTGKAPRFFRSGTAFYDEISVQIANDLGEQVVNFDVIGDAGATYSKEEVKEALLQVEPGSIVILHMNMPSQETAEGLSEAIPELKKKGYRFVKLEDFPLH